MGMAGGGFGADFSRFSGQTAGGPSMAPQNGHSSGTCNLPSPLLPFIAAHRILVLVGVCGCVFVNDCETDWHEWMILDVVVVLDVVRGRVNVVLAG